MVKILRILLIVLLVVSGWLYTYGKFNKLSIEGVTYIKIDWKKYWPYTTAWRPYVVFNSEWDYYIQAWNNDFVTVTLSWWKKVWPYEYLEVKDFDKTSISYEYSNKGEDYWFHEWTTWWPYQSFSGVSFQDEKYFYSYREWDKSYINENGEIKWPFNYIKSNYVDSKWNTGYILKENDKRIVKYAWKTFPPFEASDVKYEYLGDSTFWIIVKQDNETYLYYNDEKKWPYKEIKTPYIHDWKLRIIYVDKEDGKTYLSYNWSKIERSSECKHYFLSEVCDNEEGVYILNKWKKIKVDAIKSKDVHIYNSGEDNLNYSYKSKKDGLYYLNLWGKKKWPFLSKVVRIGFDKDNNISYFYKKDDWFYIVRWDSVVWPLDEIMSDGYWLWNYTYKKAGKSYALINWKTFWPYESIESSIYSTRDKVEYFIYKKWWKYFYNIDWETNIWPFDFFGKVFAYRENYKVYSYRNNWKDYLNINGKVKWPFRKLLNFSEEENGMIHYKYIDKYYTRWMETTIDVYEKLK